MKIERVEVRVIDMPNGVQRSNSRGPVGTGVPGSIPGKPILLKLYAEGITAFGQIRPTTPFFSETTSSVFAALSEYYAQALLGESIFDTERITEKCDDVLPENANARAIIDYALYDAMGKALNVPVYKLLGGVCQRDLPLEWSVGVGSTDKMVAEAVRAVEQFGLRTICLKVGGANPSQDVANVAAVRKALSPSVRLGVDANRGWDSNTAIRTIRAMEEHDLCYVEQPVNRGDYTGMRRVRDAVSTPIWADESVMTLHEAGAAVHWQAADVFVIKTYKMGGFRAARRAIAVAESAGLGVNIGGTALLSQIEAAVGAHLYTSTRGAVPAGEFVMGLGVFGPDPIASAEGFVARDGTARAPSGPGLGVEVDEVAVERLTLAKRIVE